MCYLKSLSIAVLFCIGVVNCEIVKPGKCPQVNVIEDFDVAKYAGKWYENQKYPFGQEQGGKCVTAQYSLNDDGTVKVVNSAVINDGTPISAVGTARLVKPGQLIVTFPGSPVPTKPNYLVLNTDYTNYSVVYSCTEVKGVFREVVHREFLWILTRERHPTAAVVNEGLSVIDANEISRNPLTITDQSDCEN